MPPRSAAHPSRRRLGLRGRVLLVTGGARGIGLAAGRAAADRGATVVLLDRDPIVTTVAGSLPGPALGVRADVTDLAGLQLAVDRVVEERGRLDVVIANAGIGPRALTVDAGDRQHQRAVLDVNLHGVWHTAWTTVPHIIQHRGHITFISSVAAFIPAPTWAAYAASKAAVEQLARSMRLELAPTGTSVGVAHLGLVDTELVAAFEADPVSAALSRRMPPSLLAKANPRDAGATLVRDIQRRSPRTLYPSWWWGPYLLRGMIGPVLDALAVRDLALLGVAAEARARDDRGAPEQDLAS